MRRLALLLAALSVALVQPAAAQASIFSVRGLGVPASPYTARTLTLGGATAMFDPLSALNPAAMGGNDTLAAVFTAAQSFRSTRDPAGTSTGRDTRFPHVMIAGPVGHTPFSIGLSLSSYSTRDFSLATVDTVSPRGLPVILSDTFSSTGGVSQIQAGGAWHRRGSAWSVGASFTLLTGTNRLQSRAAFSDSSYIPTRQRTELSYAGYGATLGVRRDFGPSLSIGAMVRTDHNVKVNIDSTRLTQVDLPISLGAGVQWRSSRLTLAGQGLWRTWSDANTDITTLDGYGSFNTLELGGGIEYARNARRGYQFPIRLGVRYATLPFAIRPGVQPHELGLSIGTGTRFAAQRGGIDLGLERISRSGGVYHERVWRVLVGITVRP